MKSGQILLRKIKFRNLKPRSKNPEIFLFKKLTKKQTRKVSKKLK